MTDCASEYSLELCEHCGSEGRIYRALPRAHYAEPECEDLGECPACKGTGFAFVECEPISMGDLDGTHGSPELDADAAKLIAMGADPGPTLEDLEP